MSIPVLIDCFTEVRRLAIAGSHLAVDDFRLKRLVDPLKATGKKAPVFAKVAEAGYRERDVDAFAIDGGAWANEERGNPI